MLANATPSSCSRTLSGVARILPRPPVRYRSSAASVKGKKPEVARGKVIKPAFQRGRIYIRGATSQHDGISGWKNDAGDNPARPPVDLSYIKDIIEVSPWPSNERLQLPHHQIKFSDEEASTLIAEPGALFEAGRWGEPELGVFLQTARHDSGRQMYNILTADGGRKMCSPEEVTFIYPAFIDADHIARIGPDFHPTSRTQLMARVTAVKKVKDLQKALQDASNGLSARFESLYDDLAPQDPESWSEISVQDVLRRFNLDESNQLAFIAAQTQLLKRPDQFVAHQTELRDLHIFHIRPRAEVARLKAFRRKLSAERNFLTSFAQRAHRYISILDSRRSRDVDEPPSCSIESSVNFTEDDLLIIALLRDSLRIIRSYQQDPYELITPSIIKAVGRHGQQINDDDTHQLLVDLGVFAPWQDTVSCRWDIISEDQGGRPGARDAIIAASRHLPARSTLSSTELYPSDPVESIRHDFGSLPVYVIDDYSAQELDDGISAERAADNPDHIWVHVHIADPTRLIHPDHELAKKASRLSESLYFINGTIPMLPPSFINKHNLSLGTGSTMGHPEHAMSISVKVAPDGVIADYHVRASIVRNVRMLKYDDVDATTGWETHQVNYPFGGQPPPPRAAVLSRADRDNLDLLYEATQRRIIARQALDTFCVANAKAHLVARSNPLPRSLENPRHPGIFRGWPDIQYAVVDAVQLTGSRNVVAEMAKLASQAASMWARDRGVPLVRRAMEPPKYINLETKEKLLQQRDWYGRVSAEAFENSQVRFTSGRETIEPSEHWGVSVAEGDGYARVSSPLRRYMDMVNHWQLKHALLHPQAPPLFAPHEMQDLIDHPLLLTKARNVDRAHTREWVAMYIQHYMRVHPELVGGDGPGPLQSLDAVVEGAGSVKETHDVFNVYTVALPKLGIRADLRVHKGKEYPELIAGSTHRVDLEDIAVAVRGVLFVRLRKERG